MVSESPVRGRPCGGLPTSGSLELPSEFLVGVPPPRRSLSLPLVDLAIPTGPLPLDSVVDGFLFVEVVPHPLYPAPSTSVICEGSSPILLEPPTAGSVGSWLGLKPYSSTSLRRRSSASFLAFRRRQRRIAASTINATATTGTTTATAILPPADSPDPESALEPVVARAGDPDLVDDDDVDVVRVVESEGKTAGGMVDVMSIVDGPSVV